MHEAKVTVFEDREGYLVESVLTKVKNVKEFFIEIQHIREIEDPLIVLMKTLEFIKQSLLLL